MGIPRTSTSTHTPSELTPPLSSREYDPSDYESSISFSNTPQTSIKIIIKTRAPSETPTPIPAWENSDVESAPSPEIITLKTKEDWRPIQWIKKHSLPIIVTTATLGSALLAGIGAIIYLSLTKE